MSGCARKRWGDPGCSGSSYKPESIAAKEMEAKLAAMQVEREKQDATLWGATPSHSDDESKKKNTVSSNK